MPDNTRSPYETADPTPCSNNPIGSVAANLVAATTGRKLSDTLFRQLFDESADAMLLLEDGEVIDCNQAAVKMMRCSSKEELLSLQFSQMSPECQPDGQSSQAKAREMFAAMADQRSQWFEWMHRRVDGEDFWVEVLLTKIEIDGREIFHTTWREIKDRKRAEAELREQARLLRSMYEAVEHSITMVNVLEDGEFRFVGWNPATERSAGIPSEAIVGKTPEELMGQEHGAVVRHDYQRCLEAGTPITYEEYLPLGGRDFWWLTTLNPLKDDRGRIHRIVVTAFDITDRKIAEAALQQAESHYRSIFETINDGIVITDLETGKVVSVNPAACRMHGYTAEEFVELRPSELVHQDTLPEFFQFVETIRAGKPFFCTGIDLHKDGSSIDVEVTSVPFRYRDKPHALSIIRDIGDRKAAEQAQARLTAILEATSDLIGIADMQGRVLYINRAGQRLLEIPPAEAPMGLPISTILTEDSKQIVLEQGIPIAIQQGIWQGESTHLSRSGREIPVSQVIIAHKAADGTPEYLSTIVRDITEQKQAEVALQQRAQREQLLNCITSQVRCSLNFDIILTTAVEEIRSFMQVDSCSFAWYCPDAEEPYWEVVKQATAEAQPSLLGRYPVAALGSLAEQLFVLDTVCIEDVHQVGDPVVRQLFNDLGYAASLNLPMQIPSGLIGVMNCQNRSPRCWTDDEVKLLQAVMEQLTIALNQAELYDQSQT
ncbi:PAS domain S-box protein, partial [Leptolyngbya sp. FACHB-711]